MDKLAHFTKNLGASFLTLVRILVRCKLTGNKYKIDRKEDTLLIMGNGPSMKELLEDASFRNEISSRDVLCVNHFCESDYYTEIKPRLYIHAAPEMYIKEVNDDLQKRRDKFWNTLVTDTQWEMDFFIPHAAKKNGFWLKMVQTNSNIRVRYYNLVAQEGFPALKHWVYNNGLGTPRVHNIIGYSLTNMIRVGYKEIYLTGVEHSWLNMISVTEDNIALVGQPHFYNPESKPAVMYKGGTGTRKLHEILHKFYLAFKGYWDIKGYAETKDVEIYNLTKGSFVDAFPRREVQDYLQNQ